MNPLLFFGIVIVIDLILKSNKNKKKVEQARRRRTDEIKPVPTKGKSIMQTIREEMEKEVQRESVKKDQQKPKKRMVKQEVYTEEQLITHKHSAEMIKQDEIKKRGQWNNEDVFNKPSPRINIIEEEKEEKRSKRNIGSFNKNILTGIIFAEIISEPKSLKNKKKSM